MCRNKKMQKVLLGLAVTMSLTGCGSSVTLVTDTGSSMKSEIKIEDYLKTDVLGQETQTTNNVYKVLTLTKGTYKEQALGQTLGRSFLNVPTSQLSLEGMTVRFGEYVVDSGRYVEEGDVIATVHTEVDELAIEEAQLKLQRLQERYQEAQEEMNERLEANREERKVTYNDYDKKIIDIRYQQMQLDWENQKRNHENQIKAAKENLDNLTKVGEIYEIKAEMAGYVNYNNKYKAGRKLNDGDYICHIMNNNQVYVVTDQQADKFYYGMKVNFISNNSQIPATVVSGGSWALYGNLDTQRAIFRLDLEQDATSIDRVELQGNLKTVENVIVIPRKAVTEEGGQYYVTVMKDDGTLLKTEFIPGGSNTEEFWVLEGLAEGMQIIYN